MVLYSILLPELGRNPVSKHQIQPEYGDEQADAGRDGWTRLARPNSQTRTGTGEYYFPCSADHEQDWQPYPVDPYSAICDDHTYTLMYILLFTQAPIPVCLDGTIIGSSTVLVIMYWLCMVINISVQYSGGLLPDIILLTQGYYQWGTRLNTV